MDGTIWRQDGGRDRYRLTESLVPVRWQMSGITGFQSGEVLTLQAVRKIIRAADLAKTVPARAGRSGYLDLAKLDLLKASVFTSRKSESGSSSPDLY